MVAEKLQRLQLATCLHPEIAVEIPRETLFLVCIKRKHRKPFIAFSTRAFTALRLCFQFAVYSQHARESCLEDKQPVLSRLLLICLPNLCHASEALFWL